MAENFSFGYWLRRQRLARDLRQVELAAQLGIAPITLRKIEADDRRPSLQLVARVAEVFGLREEERATLLRVARADLSPAALPLPDAPHERADSDTAAEGQDSSLSTSSEPQSDAVPLPSGTLTFLFTDIEGSTARWQQHPEAMRTALAQHNTVLRQAIVARGGSVVKSTGDGLLAVFPNEGGALKAAVDAQRSLVEQDWGAVGGLPVRMAVHTGPAEFQDGDYLGPTLNRAARLLAAGHGGQILLSLATAELLYDQLPTDVGLRDLGSYRLKDLARPEQVFQVVVSDLPSDFPPLHIPKVSSHTLPVLLTSFIGREREIAEVGALLRRVDVRLLTLIGPGGIGKTRLAVQAAQTALAARNSAPRQQEPEAGARDDGDLLFADGVWFVDLTSIREAALVLPAIAELLGVREAGGQALRDTLKDYLRGRRLLLVLDNFEQVATAATDVAELLSTTPGVKVLVTSRALLHVGGEREYAVEPLDVPPDADQGRSNDRSSDDSAGGTVLAPLSVLRSPSVQLFVARAQAVRPDFTLTPENAQVVAGVCRRLDGLPLAIELAAARVRLFRPEALLARLEHPLALLTSGPRNVLPRQQTLRSTIAWSYLLLAPPEQVLFARLGVFAGGWTEAAASAVHSAVSHRVPVEPDTDIDSSSNPQAASDILDLLSALVDQSLVRVHNGVDREPRFTMLETIREFALEQLEARAEEKAVREAHAEFFLALAETAEPALRTAQSAVWVTRLAAEQANLRAMLGWFTGVGDHTRLARAGYGLWRFWFFRSDWGEARRWMAPLLRADNAPELTPVLRARALLAAGMSIFGQSDFVQAQEVFAECLALFRAQGDQAGIADALEGLAHAVWGLSDYEAAAGYLRDAVATSRQLGDQYRTAWHCGLLGYASFVRGDLQAARALAGESLALFRALDITDKIAWVLPDLGLMLQLEGDYAQSEVLFNEALALARKADDRYIVSSILNYQGQGALTQGDYARAEGLFEEALGLRREIGDRRGSTAVLINLARATLARGDVVRTHALLAACVELANELEYQQGFSWALQMAAALAWSQGRKAEAARLLGADQTLREDANIPIWPDDRVRYEHLVVQVRTALGADDFAVMWSAGAALALEQALKQALAFDGESLGDEVQECNA